jgi:SAM-dependent methyltransferase
LVVAGREARETWGVDIALRWLLLARKRLDEEGMSGVGLVCGCSERLPFADESFLSMVGGDVFEHVGDQLATLAESHRVLRPGGRLVLASPNRYSLAPEPHVQVWGVGYLPRRWMPPYVRWRRGIDFRAIRCLGLAEWRRMIAGSPFSTASIRAPELPASDLATFGPLKRKFAALYNRVVSSRFGQAIALRIGPLFHVVCDRAVESTPTSIPPTPRGSTRRGERAPTATDEIQSAGTHSSPTK